jgi:hypothetical protein
MRLVLPALFLVALVLPGMAAAQDRTILVFFQPSREQRLNDAIAGALSQPPFLFSPKVMPKALVLSIPDGIDVSHGEVSGTHWSFNAVFSRDGSTLGVSQEDCNERKLSDCINQLVSDVKSAAGMP